MRQGNQEEDESNNPDEDREDDMSDSSNLQREEHKGRDAGSDDQDEPSYGEQDDLEDLSPEELRKLQKVFQQKQLQKARDQGDELINLKEIKLETKKASRQLNAQLQELDNLDEVVNT